MQTSDTGFINGDDYDYYPEEAFVCWLLAEWGRTIADVEHRTAVLDTRRLLLVSHSLMDVQKVEPEAEHILGALNYCTNRVFGNANYSPNDQTYAAHKLVLLHDLIQRLM